MIEGFYVEVAARQEASLGHAAVDEPRGAILPQLEERLGELDASIGAICRYLERAFSQANSPDEFKAKFSIAITAEGGIPFVTAGKAEGSFEIEALWRKSVSRDA